MLPATSCTHSYWVCQHLQKMLDAKRPIGRVLASLSSLSYLNYTKSAGAWSDAMLLDQCCLVLDENDLFLRLSVTNVSLIDRIDPEYAAILDNLLIPTVEPCIQRDQRLAT